MAICGAYVIAAAAVLLAGSSAAAAGESACFTFGAIKVWPIADATGDRDMSVFLADQAVLDQYAPSGKSPSGVMTFLVQNGDELTLIDTGNGFVTGERQSMLMPGLANAGFKPEDIGRVLITHMHNDHIGGLLRDGKIVFPNAVVMLSRPEQGFWTSDAALENNPDRKANFQSARRVIDAYGDTIRLFDFNDTVADGITAVDAIGHTPGHTAFLIESEGKKLLCAGDFLHSVALQMPRPDINARYDMMPEEAKQSRLRLLEKAAAESIPIAGMHIFFPGLGMVEKAGESGFSFTPGL